MGECGRGACRVVGQGDLDAVPREVRHLDPGRLPGRRGFPLAGNYAERGDTGSAGYHSLGVEKAGGEILVLAGRAHGDDQRPTVEPDLERLLHDDQVLVERLPAPPHGDGPECGGVRSV